mgnify:CR=1 FL=1
MAKITQLAKQSLSYKSVYKAQKETPQSLYLNELSVAPSKALKDKLALINQQQFKADKINESAFAKGAGNFGVLNYVDTTYTLFEKAKQGIQALQLELVDSDETIIAKTKRYVESAYESSYFDNTQLDTFFGQFVDSSQNFSFTGLSNINSLTTTESESHQALFKTGTYIKDDVRQVQKLRSQLVAFRHLKERKITQLKARLAKVNAQIPKQQQRLSALNNQRLKSLSDYQVARQLVSEDWQNVENAYQHRAHILDNHLGISFVKIRESSVSKTLQGRALLGVDSDELVPGCALQDGEIPESIEPFLESILEIPLSNWRSLKDYHQHLPDRRKLIGLLDKRHYRLDYRRQQSTFVKASALTHRMGALSAANKTLIEESAKREISYVESLVALQVSSTQVLSIEDLLNGPPHRLRHQCETLRNKIDQATHCFINQLAQLSPWIRLQWASSAEQDELQIDAPKTWPQADKALADNPNAMLTLSGIVQWWFDQLVEDADQASLLALSHLIRASLVYSASDDPNEILHGQLSPIDTTLKLGHQIRVDLNKDAHTGTLLQVVDANNQLLATLRVEDIDNNGTLTTVTQLQGQQAITINNAKGKGNYKVTGFTPPIMKSAHNRAN